MLKTDGKEFRAVVKGHNALTPTVLEYYVTGDYLVELSQGDGIFNDLTGGMMYGVTVVDSRDNEHKHELSMMFSTIKEAMDYIKELGQ